MKINVDLSRYRKREDIPKGEFTRHERQHCDQLLRRLRFLEQSIRERGGLSAHDGNGGAAFAEYEMNALEWILMEVGFLETIGD